MSVSVETVTASAANAGSVSITVTAATHLVVGVLYNNSVGQTVSGITWNGSPLSVQGSLAIASGGNDPVVETWKLSAPAPGTANIVVTMSDASTPGVIIVYALKGTDSASILGDVADGYTGSGSTHTHNTTTVASGGLLLDFFSVGDSITGGPTPQGTGQNIDISNIGDGHNISVASSAVPTVTSYSSGYTWSGGSTPFIRWAHKTVSLQAAAVVASGTPFFTQLGYQKFRP